MSLRYYVSDKSKGHISKKITNVRSISLWHLCVSFDFFLSGHSTKAASLILCTVGDYSGDKRKFVNPGFKSLKIGERRKDMRGKTIQQPWNSRNKSAIKVGRFWRCQAYRERMKTGLSPRHNHRRHDRCELVRTKTVKIYGEKRPIADSSSLGEWWKFIR